MLDVPFGVLLAALLPLPIPRPPVAFLAPVTPPGSLSVGRQTGTAVGTLSCLCGLAAKLALGRQFGQSLGAAPADNGSGALVALGLFLPTG